MTLQVIGLTVSDGGRTLVSGVDLVIEPGTITAVIGANGAGKSELVLALAGMLPITAGQMILDGQPMAGQRPESIRRAGIAAIPEGHRIFVGLSVDDNLRAAGTLLQGGLADRLTHVYAIFPELAERKGQMAETLSGGQQQMLALGHALMCNPRYLLIDEMSLGLAPLIVRRLLAVVRDLTEQGVGVLLIEQFTDLALGMAERAVVLRGGKMRFAGPASDLIASPDTLQEAYFGT